MDKVTVIQEIVKWAKAKTYLEIGVADAATFLKVRARRKVAVDPNFAIEKKLKHVVANPLNVFNKYYQMTSDVFFETQSALVRKWGVDLVFIDGLHTYEQSLRDVENSLGLLNEGGVIVLHDCSPPYEAAAWPAQSMEHARGLNIPGWTGAWNGEVWKTITFLRSRRKDLRVCVLDCDDGIGLVTRGTPEDMLEYSKVEIEKLSYKDLEKGRKTILNLKNPEYLWTFLQTRGNDR